MTNEELKKTVDKMSETTKAMFVCMAAIRLVIDSKTVPMGTRMDAVELALKIFQCELTVNLATLLCTDETAEDPKLGLAGLAVLASDGLDKMATAKRQFLNILELLEESKKKEGEKDGSTTTTG